MAKKVPVTKVLESPDAALARHLEKAEEHLIAAVELFGKKVKPNRHPEFVARLIRTQENTTWLFREELIRIRGPIKVSASFATAQKIRRKYGSQRIRNSRGRS
jgi:hypothetical protein